MMEFDIPQYIKRPIYVKLLAPLLEKDVIKVLVGQRRVGKSYLLYHVMDMMRERDPGCPIVYINKELATFDDIRTHANLLSFVHTESGERRRGCVLIDEVQEIESWRRALRSLAAEKRFDIYCTGRLRGSGPSPCSEAIRSRRYIKSAREPGVSSSSCPWLERYDRPTR